MIFFSKIYSSDTFHGQINTHLVYIQILLYTHTHTHIYIYIYKYNREIKMYFYLANVGFEPTATSTAAPSNTETTVIPTRPLRSLKKELSWPRFMLDFSALPVG